jgi:hypothetical protein
VTDLFTAAGAWLRQQIIQAAAVPVVYKRGANSLPLDAVRISKQFSEQAPGGALGTFATLGKTQTWDFLIETDALAALDPAQPKPKLNDKIEYTADGVTYVHEVSELGGEKQWYYSTPDNKLLRVHTKLIKEIVA